MACRVSTCIPTNLQIFLKGKHLINRWFQPAVEQQNTNCVMGNFELLKNQTVHNDVEIPPFGRNDPNLLWGMGKINRRLRRRFILPSAYYDHRHSECSNAK